MPSFYAPQAEATDRDQRAHAQALGHDVGAISVAMAGGGEAAYPGPEPILAGVPAEFKPEAPAADPRSLTAAVQDAAAAAPAAVSGESAPEQELRETKRFELFKRGTSLQSYAACPFQVRSSGIRADHDLTLTRLRHQ